MRPWLCVVLAAAACGGGGTGTGDDDAADAGVDAPGDGAVGPEWTPLIQRSWSLDPNVEDYRCRRIKVEQDTYISGFRAMSPTGTHHEILTISNTSAPLGDYDCNAGNHDMQMLFAGGIASNDFVFPQGVAIKLSAGMYINLNLHVVNRSDSPLSGTSGILIKTVPASEVVNEADMMFLGTFDIHIPPNNQPWVEPGSCSAPTRWTIFNLWPHMHGYARHQKVTVRRGNNTVETLLDVDYSYTDQKNYPMPSTVIEPNDELRVDCTYVNDTNITYPPGFEIQYGETATQEMCFTGFYKYPKGGNLYDCAAF